MAMTIWDGSFPFATLSDALFSLFSSFLYPILALRRFCGGESVGSEYTFRKDDDDNDKEEEESVPLRVLYR